MEEHPIHKFSNANKEFNEAWTKVYKMADVISDVSRQMHTFPYELTITGTNIDLSPYVLETQRKHTLNSKDWPDAEQIAESILALHQSRKLVKECYEALSPSDKQVVNPPDTREPPLS